MLIRKHPSTLTVQPLQPFFKFPIEWRPLVAKVSIMAAKKNVRWYREQKSLNKKGLGVDVILIIILIYYKVNWRHLHDISKALKLDNKHSYCHPIHNVIPNLTKKFCWWNLTKLPAQGVSSVAGTLQIHAAFEMVRVISNQPFLSFTYENVLVVRAFPSFMR